MRQHDFRWTNPRYGTCYAAQTNISATNMNGMSSSGIYFMLNAQVDEYSPYLVNQQLTEGKIKFNYRRNSIKRRISRRAHIRSL